MTDKNIGKKFNQLSVIKKTSVTHESEFMYELKCDCGSTLFQRISILEKGLMKCCPDCGMKNK